MSSTVAVVDCQQAASDGELTRAVWPAAASLPSPRTFVATLTVFALGLRILALRGLSLAEATRGYEARLPLGQLTSAVTRSAAAPFNLLLLWVVAHTIGSSQFDLRLTSLLFGALTIPMLYLAGRALYTEAAGVLAAVVGSVGALGVWYAQDAGSGALAILLTTTTIWALRRALATERRRYWLAWAAAAALLIWAQWSAVLVVALELAIVVTGAAAASDTEPSLAPTTHRNRRHPTGRSLGAAGAVVAAAALAVPLLLAQSRHLDGLGPAVGPLRPDVPSANGVIGLLAQLVLGFHATGVLADVVALWPLLILGMLVLLGRARHPAYLLLVGIIAVPVTTAVAGAALTGRDALQVGHLVETVPAIYLVVAGAVATMAGTQRGRWLFATVAVVALGAGLVMQQLDTAVPGLYGYRDAFGQISSVAKPDAWIAYGPSDLGPAVGYFAPRLHRLPLAVAPGRIPPGAQVFVVGSSERTPAGDRAEAVALARLEVGRRLVAVLRAPQVVVWELS